jgi:signal transduction histidine kinase
VQATGAGTTVTVSVREEPSATGERGRILMAVSDEGPGIEPEAEKKIFDAFFTTRTHGAGLGLAVVRRIIDDHAPVGASIDVRGTTPKGATFEVGLAPAASTTKRRTEPRAVASNDGEVASRPRAAVGQRQR